MPADRQAVAIGNFTEYIRKFVACSGASFRPLCQERPSILPLSRYLAGCTVIALTGVYTRESACFYVACYCFPSNMYVFYVIID